MTAMDVLLLVVLALFTVRGFWRGFIRETMGLAALVGAALAAALFAGSAGEALVARDLVRARLAPVVAGGSIFLGTYVGVNLLGWGLDRVARTLFLGPLLRAAGMVFALCKGTVLVGIGLMVGQRVVPWLVTDERIAASRLAGPMLAITDAVLEAGGEWLGVEETPA